MEVFNSVSRRKSGHFEVMVAWIVIERFSALFDFTLSGAVIIGCVD